MFWSKRTAVALLLVLLGVFALGVGRLFVLRFDAGDMYPPYSTLRADPLGAKVLYEGLKTLESISVRRNYDSFTRMGITDKTCLFLLGTRPFLMDGMPEESFQAFEKMLQRGGSLIIAYYPEGPAGNGGKNHDSPPTTLVSLQEEWGFKTARARTTALERTAFRAPDKAYKALPSEIPWHSALHFHDIKEPWQAVYTAVYTMEEHPVIIKRPLGKGRIILSADSYLFSNEALSGDRHPGLLAWFVGGSEELVFDETHLGSARSPGIAALAWEYNLYWPALGLLLVAALFIWKNASHFVPPRDEEGGDHEGVLVDRDETSGLISLLRRSLPDKDIVTICYGEWYRTAAGRRSVPEEKLKRVKAELDIHTHGSARRRDPVGAYKAVCKILSRRTEP